MPMALIKADHVQDPSDPGVGTTSRDLLTLGAVFAALVLFVGTGGPVISRAIGSFVGRGQGPDDLLVTAFLLNIALIVFGWHRHRDLMNEVRIRRHAEAQARKLADTDPLTGCLNRRAIGPATDLMISRAAESEMAVAFLMLDLDNFKQINDVHGHTAGDTLLCAAAGRIGELLPPEALFARIGGDEFACAVPFALTGPDSVDRLVRDLLTVVAQPVAHGDVILETTISVGITRSDGFDRVLDAQNLLHMADIALYHAKKNGRNRQFWFEPNMESELRFRSELETGIRRGLTNGEFTPYYQKQIDLETGELVGFEMLARWDSPTLGFVNPNIFISIAEEIGLIAPLSERLIKQSLIDASRWDPSLTLSVNISPVQMRDPWFAQKILKLLVEANFPPSRFEIEITESCLHEDIAMVRSMVTSLRNQGIRISLDDFGTGYSSLSQLRSLPFDRIKIDRSFVTNLHESTHSSTIVQSIIAIGEGLDLPVTVEGIDCEEVLTALKQYGSFKGQGYLYGQPLSAADTAAELAKLNMLQDTSVAPAPVSALPISLTAAG